MKMFENWREVSVETAALAVSAMLLTVLAFLNPDAFTSAFTEFTGLAVLVTKFIPETTGFIVSNPVTAALFLILVVVVAAAYFGNIGSKETVIE